MIFNMNKITLIPKNLLDVFIKNKKLKNIVGFLNFIKNKNNLHDFSEFCQKNNYFITDNIKELRSVLFHGSSKKHYILKPDTSEEKSIYATDDPNYAIFLATLNLKNGSASVRATKNSTILAIGLDFVNGPSKFKTGYVHIVSKDTFKKTSNREYQTNKPVEVLFSIKTSPEDITVPIYVQ